jgi:spore maturation protein CgeB
LLIAYGLPDHLDYLGEAYKGKAEKYGKATDTIISLQRDAGISLVVHNLEHALQGIPTSRFAEAITSGTILISDEHPFLRKFFGDNILYFNSLENTENIYKQIKDHIIWIKSHKEEAAEKTKNAYEIFVDEWTLEKQLQKIVIEVAKYRKANE